ncbi:NUDIX domain-containing protein [Kitasatospora saccharophila]|uniref:NUDIX domain-containing protein n=1 Tax=Kitasatospora saccharophila TaxID=407973 RepID=UPI003645E94D
MPATSAEIAAATRGYLQRHPAERDRLRPLLEPSATASDPTDPATPPARVTCSGVVVDRDLRVLHVRHRAAGPVPGPGGPGGPGEPVGGGLLATAIRGVTEETGIPAGALRLVPHLLDTPVDIDVNETDPDPGEGEVAHRHYDFRFVFQLADREPPQPPQPLLQAAEAAGAGWRPLAEVSSPGCAPSSAARA